jgi:hypothetical protein
VTPPARSGRARALVAALVLLGATLVFLWPVLAHRGGGIYTGPGVGDAPPIRLLAGGAAPPAQGASGWSALALSDTLRGVYVLAWWGHVLAGDARVESFYDANVLYPLRHALTYSDLQLGVVPAFAPVYLTTADPVLAYDVAQLVGTFGCALGFCLLLYSWTGSALAGVVAGLASIVAPYRIGSVSLLYLHFIPYLPVAFLAADAVIARRRPLVAAGVLAACLLLQASSSGYLIYVGFLAVPLYCLGALLESDGRERVRAAAPLAAAGVVALVVLAALYRPFIALAASGAIGTPAPADGRPAYNPWMMLLWEHPWLNLRQHLVGNCCAPLLVLAGLGLFESASRRRWTSLGLVAAGAALALGPSLTVGPMTMRPLPWEWLARLVPGFTVIRQTYLTSTLVGVGVTCLAGLGAAWLAARARERRVWTLAFVVLGAWSARIYTWQLDPGRVVTVAHGAAVPAAYRWLAEHGEGAPLLELPNPLGVDAIYAYFSTYHWLPTFNGSYSSLPPGRDGLSARAPSVLGSSPEAAAFLRDVPVRWVLVHGDLLPPGQLAELAHPPPHLEEAARFGNDVIFRVRQPASDRS